MAKGPGGPIVGRVRLKVSPDTRGFREDVERQLNGLRDLEIDVDPNMDGFRRKVNSATRGLKATVRTDLDSSRLRAESAAAAKGASGNNVEFDSTFDTRGLSRRAARAAKNASGKKVYFIQEWKNRVNGPNIGPRNLALPGLKSDLKFLSSQAKGITLDRFNRSAIAARKAVRGITWGMEGVQIVSGNVTKSFARGSLRSLKSIGRLARNAISPLVLLGQTLRWATAGPIIERSLGRALGGIRKKVIRLGKSVGTWVSRPFRKMGSVLVRDFQAASRELGRMRSQMGEMLSGAGRAFREEGAKFGKLIGSPFRAMRKHLRPVTDELGRMKTQMGEMWRDSGRVLREEAKTWGKTLAKPFRAIGRSYSKSAAGEELRRISGEIDKVRRRMRGLNQDIQLTGITGALQKVSGLFRKTARDADVATRKTKEYQVQIREAAKPISGGTRRRGLSFSSLFKRDMEQVPKIAGRSGRSASSKFWGAWRKFHQPENRIFGLTEMGWMTAAITALIAPLSGLIGAALGSLPALGLAAAAALGATVLGWEGIKQAASAAAPAVEDAKRVLSGTFQDRLTPQFEQLGKGLRTITPDLNKVAHGLSDFSQGIVDAATGEQGITHIQKALGNTADLFSKLQPFATDFTAGLLEMGAAGSETFDYLGDKLNNFGSSFRESVSEMAETGVLQDSIEAMYDVVGSIGNNLGKVMRAGMEEMPDMSAAFTRGLDDIGDGLVAITPLLSDFSQTIFDAFGAIGRGLEKAAPVLTEFFDGIGPGFKDALSGIGDLGGAILDPVSNFLTGLAPGAGDTLSLIGDGFSLLADGINKLNGPVAEGKLGTLNDAFHSFGTTMGEFIPAMLGQYNDAIDQLEDPNPEDYEGFLGFAAFSFDQYIADIKRGTAELGPMIGKALGDAATVAGEFFEGFGELIAKSMGGLMTSIGDTLSPIGDKVREWWDSFTNIFTKEGREANKRMASERETKVMGAGSLKGILPSVEDITSAASEWWDNVTSRVGEMFSSLSTHIGDLIPDINIGEMFSGITEGISSAFTGVIDGIVSAFSGIGPAISGVLSGVASTVGSFFSGLGSSIMNTLSGLPGQVSSLFSTMGSSITSAVSGAASSVGGIFSGMVSNVSGLVSGMVSGVIGSISTMGSTIVGTLSSAASSAVSAISGMVSQAVSLIGTLPGKARSALGNVGGILVSSGRALVQGFVDGIRSMIGAVTSAASSVVSAARDFFPFSPAKKGPFSGRGYTLYSGMVLVADFAKGMESQKEVAAKAASDVVSAVQRRFNDFTVDPVGNLEKFHRKQILQPVLESNARKIHAWREREGDSAERLSERIASINESNQDQAKKEERIAEAREQAAERSAESREKLLESLERPYYSDIDRSIQSYYVDGMRDVLSDGLSNAVRDADLAGKTRQVSMHAVNEGRRIFGNNSLFDLVDYNVNADHFADALYRAIEEAGIAEIPIDFAVSNLSQLKSDLDLGDGVISRALDQAMSYDPAATDARYARQNPVEIHYHVADMEEAIRLEKQRERKEMMKHK